MQRKHSRADEFDAPRMSNLTSGVPSARSCSTTQCTAMRSRFAGLSAGMQVQVLPGSLTRRRIVDVQLRASCCIREDSDGRQDRDTLRSGSKRRVRDPRRPQGCVRRSKISGVSCTLYATDKQGPQQRSPEQLRARPNEAGRNAQPRGPLSKARSREHVCLIGPCVNIEPATQLLEASAVGSRSHAQCQAFAGPAPCWVQQRPLGLTSNTGGR